MGRSRIATMDDRAAEVILATIGPHFGAGHWVVSFVSALRREGIVAVGIPLADATVLTVDQHLAALANGGFTRGRDGLALRAVDGRRAFITCPLHCPTALMRHNVLILPRQF